jgi:hypothetical protein
LYRRLTGNDAPFAHKGRKALTAAKKPYKMKNTLSPTTKYNKFRLPKASKIVTDRNIREEKACITEGEK